MKGRTHLIVGAGSAAALLLAANSSGEAVGLGEIVAASVLAGLGALAPDIDHATSTVSRALPRRLLARGLTIVMPVLAVAGLLVYLGAGSIGSRALELLDPVLRIGWMLLVGAAAIVATSLAVRAFTRHRGATHSLVFAVFSAALVGLLCARFGFDGRYGLAFGWGWLTHLATDALTRSGVPGLLWPFVRAR